MGYKQSKECVTKAPSQQGNLLAIPDVMALGKGAHLSTEVNMAARQFARLLQRAAPAALRVLADGGTAKPYTPILCRSVSILCRST